MAKKVKSEPANTIEEVKPERPPVHSPEWVPFVMQHFQADELFDGCPTRDGLSRLVQLLVGDITESAVNVIQSPNMQNGWHAVCEHVVFIRPHGKETDVIFRDVAEASSLNTDPIFLRHSAATAATRAEGRALKKALNLRRVHTAEEKVDGVPELTDIGFVNQTQLMFLNTMCKKANINVLKFMNNFTGEVYEDPRKVPYEKAQAMFERLNEYQNKVPIPESIVGFDSSWLK